jgi:beta-lactamase class A
MNKVQSQNTTKGAILKYGIFVVIGMVIGSATMSGLFYNKLFNGSNSTRNPFSADSRLEQGKYKFIRPILDSGYGDEEETLKWFPAERQLKTSVEDIIAESPDISSAVFFLNLDNSGWFGVNNNDTFIPASLLKLPMLISYFKLHETEKDLFDQQILYQGENYNKLRNIGIGNGAIKPGETYTVRQLIEEMIIHSDNNALQLLYKYRQNSLKQIFDDLKIPLPSTDQEIADKDFVTTRDIGRFLLVLYNASYLNTEDSEQALKILSEAAFKDGLVAGVPENIVVSHKFGERELVDENDNLKVELHDCGIVYHPQIPYVVCIMTKGSSLDAQKTLIQKISRRLYEGVSLFSTKQK